MARCSIWVSQSHAIGAWLRSCRVLGGGGGRTVYILVHSCRPVHIGVLMEESADVLHTRPRPTRCCKSGRCVFHSANANVVQALVREVSEIEVDVNKGAIRQKRIMITVCGLLCSVIYQWGYLGAFMSLRPYDPALYAVSLMPRSRNTSIP